MYSTSEKVAPVSGHSQACALPLVAGILRVLGGSYPFVL